METHGLSFPYWITLAGGTFLTEDQILHV